MPFQPGTSGNPGGRKPGTGKMQRYRLLLQSRADDIINLAIARALSGEDPTALKMCFSALIPPWRAESPPIEFPLPSAASLTELGQSVISSIGDGILSPEQGAAVLSALACQARIVEVDDLTRQVKELQRPKPTVEDTAGHVPFTAGD